MMFWLFKFAGEWLVLALVSLAALRWGAGPERASAGALVSLVVLDLIYHAVFGMGASYRSVDLGHAAIDTIVAVALVSIALRANRIYPLCLASLQLVAVLAHIARQIGSHLNPLAYSAMIFFPSYLQIAVLLCGVVSHGRRRGEWGTYRSWRTS